MVWRWSMIVMRYEYCLSLYNMMCVDMIWLKYDWCICMILYNSISLYIYDLIDLMMCSDIWLCFYVYIYLYIEAWYMCFMLYTLKTTVCHIPMTVHASLASIRGRAWGLAAFRGSCNNFKRKWRTLLTREKRSALTKPTIGERITSGTSCFVILPYCLEMYLIYNVETSEVDMHQISANRHFSTGGPRSQHWRDPCGCIESLQFRGVVENRILQGAG